LKAGQIYRFKDTEDSQSLYLIVSHEDAGLVYLRMVTLTGPVPFSLTGITADDDWFKEHMELAYENIQTFLPLN
jgi:hypothetical protein